VCLCCRTCRQSRRRRLHLSRRCHPFTHCCHCWVISSAKRALARARRCRCMSRMVMTRQWSLNHNRQWHSSSSSSSSSSSRLLISNLARSPSLGDVSTCHADVATATACAWVFAGFTSCIMDTQRSILGAGGFIVAALSAIRLITADAVCHKLLLAPRLGLHGVCRSGPAGVASGVPCCLAVATVPCCLAVATVHYGCLHCSDTAAVHYGGCLHCSDTAAGP
jgi:hypothetical protein